MKNKFASIQCTVMSVCNKHLVLLSNCRWLMALILFVSVAGCQKISEEDGLRGICPEVLSTNPASNATGINLNAKVVAAFNKKIDSSTLTTSTFTVKHGTTLVPGYVSYSGLEATFSPLDKLDVNTTYTGSLTTDVKDMDGNALVDDYIWSFTTGNSADITAPTVISTDPSNAATGVALNNKITATFSEPMAAASVATAFVVKQGSALVAGSVTYSGITAVFSPATVLAANTVYTATITTSARDTAGNSILNDYVWNFTTGGASDLIKPTVISTDPLHDVSNVSLDKKLSAVFSEEMNPVTINALTFTLKDGANSVAGTLSYSGTKAVFVPLVNLTSNTEYTATITTGAQDLSGNAIGSDYVWQFRTGTVTPLPFLGSISLFGVFGGSAGITNQGLNTVINNGSIGTTGASTLITGFHDGVTGDVYTETPLNVGAVGGRIYTAPPAPGNATSFQIAMNGLLDATNAYNSISPASKPGGIDPGAGELGGLTLAPGVYKSASGTFKITNGNLVLDAMGDPNAVWIFQTAAGLTVGVAGPAGARSVNLINGGLAKNVFWHVGSAAVINGAGGGVMTGTIISSAGVTFSTAGNAVQTVLNGRAISLNASVTLVNTTINVQ